MNLLRKSTLDGLCFLVSDDNDCGVDNMNYCPARCYQHFDVEGVGNDNFSVMNNLFTGAFDHILDLIFLW